MIYEYMSIQYIKWELNNSSRHTYRIYNLYIKIKVDKKGRYKIMDLGFISAVLTLVLSGICVGMSISNFIYQRYILSEYFVDDEQDDEIIKNED